MDRYEILLLGAFEAATIGCGGTIDTGGTGSDMSDEKEDAASPVDSDSGIHCERDYGGGSSCQWSYTVTCNQPVPSTVGGTGMECERYCGMQVCGVMPTELSCYAVGGQRVACTNGYDSGGGGAGRRPQGLRLLGRPTATPTIATWLASAAAMEAASVRAFLRMADELEAFGAPRVLVRAARRAANDEARHARRVRSLARRYRAPRVRVAIPRFRPRALEAFAIENAREGCVIEAYGALVNTYQAMTASDPTIREAYAEIAIDEVAHAALSLRVHDWVLSVLDAESCARVERARDEALAHLALDRQPASNALGLPTPEIARAMHRELARLTRAS